MNNKSLKNYKQGIMITFNESIRNNSGDLMNLCESNKDYWNSIINYLSLMFYYVNWTPVSSSF